MAQRQLSSNRCTIVGMESRDAQIDDLEGRVAAACGVLNVANARLVELTAELIETDLWRGYGIRSVEHWLTLKTGLSPERARHVAEVAAATKAMPVTGQSLADGELSFEQVHAVAKHFDKFQDAEAASFARVATVPQIRRTLSRYVFAGADADVAAADSNSRVDSSGHEDEPGHPWRQPWRRGDCRSSTTATGSASTSTRRPTREP